MKKTNYLTPRADIVLLQLEQSVATVSTLTLFDAIDSPNTPVPGRLFIYGYLFQGQ